MTSGNDRFEPEGELADGAGMRHALGTHLRALRQRSGKSLRVAASLAGMSPTFVSLVERGRTEIALSRLVRLADVYDANVADLLAEIERPSVEFVPAAAALAAPRSSGDPKLVYLTSPSWRLQPFRIEIEPGEALEALAHAGEEFVHCVSGVVEMAVDGQTWALHAGDTIVVPPHAPHSYRNRGDLLGVVVGAVAATRRWRSGDPA
jgi:quercetin dioxygenase-like cupin family protein